MIEYLWKMGLYASILIAAVAIVALFIRKYPKKYSYILWLIVLVRLLCPGFIESSHIKYNGIYENVINILTKDTTSSSYENEIDKSNIDKSNTESNIDENNTDKDNTNVNKANIGNSSIKDNKTQTNYNILNNNVLDDSKYNADKENLSNNSNMMESFDVLADKDKSNIPFKYEKNFSNIVKKNEQSFLNTVFKYGQNHSFLKNINITNSNITKNENLVLEPDTAGRKNIENNLSNNEGIKTKLQNNKLDIVYIMKFIWITAALFIALWFAVKYIKVRKLVKTAVYESKNVWHCDGISSPFVMGIINPKVYMPYNIDISKEEYDYILMHEMTHIKHKDNYIKLAEIAAVCIHWWNPLVWYAVYKLNQSMEMFCDETVVKNATLEERKKYSITLLNYAIKQGYFIVPSFSETNTERRIINIMKSKKPKLLIIAAAVIVVSIFAAVSVFTPKTSKANDDSSQSDELQNKVTDINDDNSNMAGTYNNVIDKKSKFINASDYESKSEAVVADKNAVLNEGEYYIYFLPKNSTGKNYKVISTNEKFVSSISKRSYCYTDIGYEYGNLTIYDNNFNELKSFKNAIIETYGIYNNRYIVIGFVKEIKDKIYTTEVYMGVYDLAENKFAIEPEYGEYKTIDGNKGFFEKAVYSKNGNNCDVVVDKNNNVLSYKTIEQIENEEGVYSKYFRSEGNYYVMVEEDSSVELTNMYDENFNLKYSYITRGMLDESAKKAGVTYYTDIDDLFFVDENGKYIQSVGDICRNFIEKNDADIKEEYELLTNFYPMFLPAPYMMWDNDLMVAVKYKETVYVFDCDGNIKHQMKARDDVDYKEFYDDYYCVREWYYNEESMSYDCKFSCYTYDGSAYVSDYYISTEKLAEEYLRTKNIKLSAGESAEYFGNDVAAVLKSVTAFDEIFPGMNEFAYYTTLYKDGKIVYSGRTTNIYISEDCEDCIIAKTENAKNYECMYYASNFDDVYKQLSKIIIINEKGANVLCDEDVDIMSISENFIQVVLSDGAYVLSKNGKEIIKPLNAKKHNYNINIYEPALDEYKFYGNYDITDVLNNEESLKEEAKKYIGTHLYFYENYFCTGVGGGENFNRKTPEYSMELVKSDKELKCYKKDFPEYITHMFIDNIDGLGEDIYIIDDKTIIIKYGDLELEAKRKE